MNKSLLSLIFLFSLNVFGQELMDYSVSSCSEKSYPELIRHRIVSKQKNQDTMVVRLGLVLNCCVDPELELSKSNDSLFVRINNISDILCMCECCFELEMELSGITEDSLKIFLMKKDPDSFDENFNFDFYPVELKESSNKYVFPTPSELLTFENYEGKTNQVSDQGKKIGLWKLSSDNYEYLRYYASEENSATLSSWTAVYSLDGELMEICGDNGLGDSGCAQAIEYYRLFED